MRYNPSTSVISCIIRIVAALLFIIHGGLNQVCASEELTFGDATFKKTVKPFLGKFCMKCHGPQKQKSRIRYDLLPSGYSLKDANLWTKVHEVLASGEMPPDDETPPESTSKNKILEWIEKRSLEARKTLGVNLARRLNRRELAQTLTDLLGLPIDFKRGLPEDVLVDGFDTGLEGLQDTAASLEATLDVIQKAVAPLRFLEPEPSNPRKLIWDFKRGNYPKEISEQYGIEIGGKGMSIVPESGLSLIPTYHDTYGEKGWLSVTLNDVPKQGLLRIRFSVSARMPETLSPPWLIAGYQGNSGRMGPTVHFTQPVIATLEKPQKLDFYYFLESIALHEKADEENAAKITQSAIFKFKNVIELPWVAEAIKGISINGRKPDKKLPMIFLRDIEVDFPHAYRWPGLGAMQLEDNDASARKILSTFLTRAFRRPVLADEVGAFLSFYKKRRSAGASFDEAMRNAFASALTSSRFRFLKAVEGKDPLQDQYAIASRLSYMLWSSMPDEGLLKLAGDGKLKSRDILRTEIDRLLEDSRSDRFFTAFTKQWLDLNHNIRIWQKGNSKIGLNRFTGYMANALKHETVAYHKEIIRSNLPAKTLIKSNFAMMNDSSSWFYGYPNLVGSHFQKVKLKPDDPRGGGILGHAGIMAMTTEAGPNWPIYRGAWMLRHVLDDAPPPAPLEVPELEPNARKNRGKTMRQLLKKHTADPLCSVCHKTMDPLGFGFQNFDFSGRWRKLEYAHSKIGRAGNEDIEWRWSRGGETRPVDSAGALPRGETFNTFAEMRDIVATKYLEDVVRGYLKRLWLYGTGRQPGVQDLQQIKRILDSQRSNGFPLRDVLKAAITAPGFLVP